MAANSKNALPPYQNIVAASMTSTVTSSVTDIRYIDNVACELEFTGTPTGTFFVQGSLDYNPQTGNAGNWVSLVLNPVPVASGSAGTILLDMNQLSFPYVRIQYVPSSGTGTLNSYISGKAV